jgi:hypothetical protein
MIEYCGLCILHKLFPYLSNLVKRNISVYSIKTDVAGVNGVVGDRKKDEDYKEGMGSDFMSPPFNNTLDSFSVVSGMNLRNSRNNRRIQVLGNRDAFSQNICLYRHCPKIVQSIVPYD